MLIFQRINLILASITATLEAFKFILRRCCLVRYMEIKDVPFIRYRTFSFIRLILQTSSSQCSPVMKKKCSIISIKWISVKRLAPFNMCRCESMLQCEPSKYTFTFFLLHSAIWSDYCLFIHVFMYYLFIVCISTNSPRYNGQHKRNTKRLFSERKKGDKRKRISCERVSNVVAPFSKKLLRDYGPLVVYHRSSMKPPPLKWGPLSDTCSPPPPPPPPF